MSLLSCYFFGTAFLSQPVLWFVSILSTWGSMSAWTEARITQMSCRKSYQRVNIKVIFQRSSWLYGILLLAGGNLFTVKNGSFILFLSFCLEWCRTAVYSLEDRNWNAARVIWSLHSMYSHMCQVFAEAEMRRWGWWRGWQSKRSWVGIDADGGTRYTTVLLCFSLCLSSSAFFFFFLSSRKASTLFQYRRAKQISHMDMYANLGDDEATLWGLNRHCDDVN